MKIKKGQIHINLSEEREDAKLIRQGHKFNLNKDNKIKVLSGYDEDSPYYLLNKINESNWEEAKPYIIKYLENLI